MVVHILYMIIGAAVGFLACALYVIARDSDRIRPIGCCPLCGENIYTTFSHHYDQRHRTSYGAAIKKAL